MRGTLDSVEKEIPIPVTDPGSGAMRTLDVPLTQAETPLVEADWSPRLTRLSLRANPPIDAHTSEGGLTLTNARVVSPTPLTPHPSRPNVVLYMVDTLRADRLGCYGYTSHTTSAIDAFAADAVVYDRPLAQTPWTRASVASVLTGLYPRSHGTHDRNDRLPGAVRVVSEALHDGGYRTATVTTNGNLSSKFGFDRGYDDFIYLPERLDGPIHQSAEQVHDAALAWLDEQPDDQPFFLYVHTSNPHGPYTPLEPWRGQFAPDSPGGDFGTIEWLRRLHKRELAVTPDLVRHLSDLYDAEVAYADAQFSHFVDALKRRGVYENTLFIFTSDHGEEFHEHNQWEHGQSLYREVLDVPLIVRYPFHGAPRGERSTALAQHVDLVPTVFEATSIATRPEVEGRSLYGLLADDQSSVRQGFAYLALHGNYGEAVVEGGRKYVRQRRGDQPLSAQLFERTVDPWEQTNLLTTQRGEAERLGQVLQDHGEAHEGQIAADQVVIDGSLAERLRALGYIP